MSALANEAVGINDFETWLNSRNRWLQTAARQLIDNKRLPNEDDLAELVRLCKLEAIKLAATMCGWLAPEKHELDGKVEIVIRKL